MRRLIFAVTSFVSMVLLTCWLSAQDFSFQTQQLKERQKAQVKALELKHNYRKESMKGQNIPKATRLKMEHEMEREEQALRQKHKHQRQELKDRQRLLKENSSG